VHEPETRLIPLVLQAAAGRRPAVTTLGDDYPTPDGTCLRDYIHVVDIARTHVLALGHLAAGSRVHNLGCGGDGYSVQQVIDSARQVTRRPITAQMGPRRAGDPVVLIASCGWIQWELGWQPTRQDLGTIVASAWAWMVAHADGYA
jgi:UDP-glucose 4-epimerase